jgi:hypothetical protein
MPSGPSDAQQALTCRVAVADRTVSCTPGLPSGASGDLIIGGQHRYLELASDSVSYDAGTEVFSFRVTVKNLMPQPIGTHDGTTPDTAGVKVFFNSGPTVAVGSGQVTILNADGTGAFTGTGQPFYRYDGILQTGETSAPRRWNLSVPGTVGTFVFTLYVSAAVPTPQGFLHIGTDTMWVPRNGTLPPLVQVLTATGSPSGAPITWTVEDTTVARVSGGTVVGKGAFGVTRLFASSGTLADTVVLKVGIPPFVKVSTGDMHTCGLDADGHAFCWGFNVDGELGVDTAVKKWPAPVNVWQGSTRFTDIAAGGQFTCALTATGEAWCWGSNWQGEMGTGAPISYGNLPTRVQQGGVAYTRISAGLGHACALDATGQAWCWGWDNYGETGVGPTPTHRILTPNAVQQGGLAFVRIAAGGNQSCALTSDGHAYCWGEGKLIGDGTNNPTKTPVATAQPDTVHFSELDAGTGGTCGTVVGSGAWCWGDNSHGALGVHTGVLVLTPYPLPGIVRPHPGGQGGGCGLTTASSPTCWAAPYYSRAISPPNSYLELDARERRACGLVTGGDVYCWGIGSWGELGNGVASDSYAAPQLVKR